MRSRAKNRAIFPRSATRKHTDRAACRWVRLVALGWASEAERPLVSTTTCRTWLTPKRAHLCIRGGGMPRNGSETEGGEALILIHTILHWHNAFPA
jgi:hypothetical protein